jgi:hypothetical protein
MALCTAAGGLDRVAALARSGALHLGNLVRARVTRGIDFPPTWSASMNATDLGNHASREAAMHRIETAILHQMRPTLADWVTFQVDPGRPRRAEAKGGVVRQGPAPPGDTIAMIVSDPPAPPT